MIKYLSAFVLFTAMTKTYVVWAWLLGQSVAAITLLFFLIKAFLILSFSSNYRIKVDSYWFPTLVVFLFIVPLIVMALTGNLDLRVSLLNLFFLFVFWLTLLVGLNFGKAFLMIVTIASFIFTVVAGLISTFFFELFSPFAELTNSEAFYWGRAFGFYLQPNSLAIAINMLYLLIFGLSKKVNLIIYLFPLALVGILAAGSRTNMLGFFIINMAVFLLSLRNSEISLKKPVIRVLIGSIAILISTAPYLFEKLSGEEFKYLTERLIYTVEIVSESGASDKVSEDTSVQDRLNYQLSYLKAIDKKPFLGYGFGVQESMIENGLLKGSSHNSFLEYLLQGGLFYFFCFALFSLMFWFFLFNFKPISFSKYAYVAFLIFMTFYINFSTTFFGERLVYVVIGVFAFIVHSEFQGVKK